jgi:hypothetical protein
MINLDHFDAIIFGDYAVLTNTPFKDDAPLTMLPGRAEYLAYLRDDRYERGQSPLHYAVAANKGGRAWNKHTEAEGEAEVRQTAEWIGAKHFAICFACPTCAPGNERYSTPEMLARRKPEPIMFRELAEQVGVPLERVLIVDHYQDSYPASKTLGCGWYSPSRFFAQAVQYIPVSREEIVRELAQFSLDAELAERAPLDGGELDLFDVDAVLEAQARAMEEE